MPEDCLRRVTYADINTNDIVVLNHYPYKMARVEKYSWGIILEFRKPIESRHIFSIERFNLTEYYMPDTPYSHCADDYNF